MKDLEDRVWKDKEMRGLKDLIAKIVELQMPGAGWEEKRGRRMLLKKRFLELPLEKKADAIAAAKRYIELNGDVATFLSEGRKDGKS